MGAPCQGRLYPASSCPGRDSSTHNFTGSATGSFRRNPSLSAAEIVGDDEYRASRAIAFGHNVIGKAYGGMIPPPNMVYLRLQTPTTSIPLNPLGARGWQVVPALV